MTKSLHHVSGCWFPWGLALALLLSAQTVAADAPADSEAPELMVDLFSSTRIYPNADAALMGFAMGVIWRPTDKCLHIAGEGFARFGSRNSVAGEDLKMRTAGGALGALTRIECGHVLASAAIPLIFPARRIGSEYYCDGGIRFNTPLAPAIRSGADRLVVVSALHREEAGEDPAELRRRTAAYPNPLFILGNVLNALLLDPINYDLGVMRRFNRVWGVLEDTLRSDEMSRVREVLEDTRGVAYRRLETLVFHPSQDIGDITTRHARRLGAKWLPGILIAASARFRAQFESDLLSFILFDGDFAEELISLGRHDAQQRADEVVSFFSA